MKIARSFGALALAVIAGPFCPRAHAADCLFLNRNLENLQDAQLFFQPPNDARWMPADSSTLQFSGQKVRFAYVIRATFGQPRRGVIVLKSGRPRQMNDDVAAPAVSRVQLVRRYSSFGEGENRVADNGSCRKVLPFGDRGEKDVSARSYDLFHDTGRTVPEQATIDSFHHPYVGREGRCRSTSYGRADSRTPPDARSNRGQFSYDESIVGKSAPSQLAWYFSSSAVAEPAPPFAERRVELLRYAVEASAPACVLFTITIPVSNAFVRINDLEGLKESGVYYYVRADEQNWSFGP